MKRIQHILLLLISIVILWSCADILDQEYTADGKVNTSLSVIVPQLPDAHPRTRAMALQPHVQSLYLAVFDNNGYLLEYVQATPVEGKVNETSYGYTVSLTPTDVPTTIHFIGNPPSDVQFGTETESIGRLFTESGNESYWQRVHLTSGINSGIDLTGIRLIRNFAWIKLQKASTGVDNFTIDSYCVVNKRTKGSVAPYNTSRAEFAEYASVQSHTDLINEGYNGFIPAGATLDKSIPDESTWFTTSKQDADDYAYFIYERELPSADPCFILMKGTYTPTGGAAMTDRYYKVDLRDNNGKYFPILRNFRYNVQLTSVKHEGHASAEAAAAGAGSGDVSTAIETEDYTNISNNVARIFVSYTDTTLVNQTDELKLRYKFMVFETKDSNGSVIQPQSTLNQNVTIETPINGDVINSYTNATTDATDGWRELTISTKEVGTSRKTQDIVLKGSVTIGTGENAKTYSLQRKVTLNLRPKYTMQLECDPNSIKKAVGEPFDLVIKVPGGLGSAMFPLEFQLEAEEQSMTPNMGDDLPAVTGKSIISTKSGKTTIGFMRHLEWDDYEALPNVGGYKLVPCHFKSNKAASATAIYAQNKYFNQASTTLGNYDPMKFTNLSFSSQFLPTIVNTSVEFKFTLSDLASLQNYVTVVLDNLDPAENETRLTPIGTIDGKAAYSFSPQKATETLMLQNTEINTFASVTLMAYRYDDAYAYLCPKSLTIPKNNIKVGTTNIPSSNTTFSVYTKHPGTSTDTTNRIIQFTARSGGNNNDAITINNAHLQSIAENGGNVYVQFSVTSGSFFNPTTTYYVATVQLSELLKTGGATLDFERQ